MSLPGVSGATSYPLSGNLSALGDSLLTERDYVDALMVYRLELGNDDVPKASVYINMGKAFFYLQEQDSALFYYKQAAEWALSNNKDELLGMAYFNQGSVYTTQGDYAEGIAYTRKALQTFKQIGKEYVVAQAFFNLALLYKKNALFDEAIINLDSALQRFEKNDKDKIGLAKIFQLLGNIYREQDEDSLSLEYHQRALQLKEEIGDQRGLFASYNDIGNTYLKLYDYQQALNYYQRALQAEDTFFVSTTLDNIGETYFRIKDYSQAEQYWQQSLSLRERIGDKHGVAATLTELGELYVETENWQRAEEFLKQGGDLARQNDYKEIWLSNYQSLSKLYERTGRFREALNHSRMASELREEIYNQTREKILQRMKISLRLRDFENQNQVLMEEAQLNRLQVEQERSEKRWIWTTLAIIVIGALWIILLSLRNARWQKARSREIQHRTKNFLQTLANLYDFQSRGLNDPEAKALVMESEGRVNAMLLIHNSLSGLSNRVEMSAYLQRLVKAIKDSFAPALQHTDLQFSIEELYMDADQATPLALIVNELVTNSFKYGLPGLELPALKVALTTQGKKELLLEITDNGGEGKRKAFRQDSYGLRMVHVFARQLGGNFKLHFNAGETRAEVRLKIGTAP
ncbi:MAG TPA: hypothetical protein DDW81_02640 [Cryomorphaceae bacterium]|nr:hypothetical protein [Cryomorphaceae bacterium]|tara:strand:+ start:1977 stop:3878 length:1902 start_codon:yes stop_codon:yes gene_type:complete